LSNANSVFQHCFWGNGTVQQKTSLTEDQPGLMVASTTINVVSEFWGSMFNEFKVQRFVAAQCFASVEFLDALMLFEGFFVGTTD